MPSTSTFTQSRNLPSPNVAASTLSLLREHATFARLQPLITSIKPLLTPPRESPDYQRSNTAYKWYRQYERISVVPGIWYRTITFDSYFLDIPDSQGKGEGIEAGVYAPLGVRLTAIIRVQKGDKRVMRAEKDGDAQNWKVVETSEIKCSSMLMWFVKRTHRKAHKDMMDNLVHEAKKRAYLQKDGEAESSVGASVTSPRSPTSPPMATDTN